MSTSFHLSLPCVNVEETKAFYLDNIGAVSGRQSQNWIDINLFGHQITFTQAGKFDFNNPNYVFALVVDRNDHVWAGTWGGGVSHYDGKVWTNYTTRDGLAGNIVYSIAQDQSGIIWFGTNNGLSRYDGRSWINYDTHIGLLDNNVYAIASTPSGELWVGTKNGVSRLIIN